MDYTSINVIADRIKRNKLLQDIPFETILDYAFEFIKIVGMPKAFLEKVALIKVEDYKGVLPCDIYNVIQVRTVGGEYFRYSTDSFHMSHSKDIKDNNMKSNGFTYKIQGSCIITSIPECTLEISYMAFNIDDDNYPLIPDNGSYPRALEEYIIKECYNDLFDQGKITLQSLQLRQQKYAWAVGQAQTDLIRPSLDQMTSLSNMRNRFLPYKKEYDNGFITEGAK